MTTISVQEAQARLAEVIHSLGPGQQIVITESNRPVARLVAEASAKRQPRKPGSAKGILTVASDDDAHLSDFSEYMP